MNGLVKSKYKKEKIGQPFKVFENKFNRKFHSEKIFKKLVKDIIYLIDASDQPMIELSYAP